MIGLTPDELSHCQRTVSDLAFIFAWLEGEEKPEGGKLFLANPAATQNYMYHINRNSSC